MRKFYAHNVEGQSVEGWHILDDHLKGTAEREANMAKEFGCSRWEWLAGLWHDMGRIK